MTRPPGHPVRATQSGPDQLPRRRRRARRAVVLRRRRRRRAGRIADRGERDARPDAAVTAAAIHSNRWKPSSSSAPPGSPPGTKPASSGTAAIATSCPVRATALLTPDATPARRDSTAPSAVVVSGATVIVESGPEDEDPGQHRRDVRTHRRRRGSSKASPAAHTSGPTLIGSRGPMRSASAPERADSRSMSTVIGVVAAPASSGEYPSDSCSTSPSRNSDTASAP